MLSQDIVVHVIDTAASAIADTSQQLLGGALGTRQPALVLAAATQLAGCGVPAGLAAVLTLPSSATGRALPNLHQTPSRFQPVMLRVARAAQHLGPPWHAAVGG
jgi:hypothetical protein